MKTVSLILLYIFLAASFRASANGLPAPHCIDLLEITIHGQITDRPTWKYMSSLKRNVYQEGIAGPLESFPLDDVLAGRKSVLNLGEGNSDFTATILAHRAKLVAQPDMGVHAVDQAYIHAFDPKESSLSDFQILNLMRFPNNYHGQVFQNLQIRDDHGRVLFFDEAVSAFSLNFVLAKAKSNEERVKILRSILKTLKPAGYLRFWPYFNEDDKVLRPLLAELFDSKEIANFSIGPRSNSFDPSYPAMNIQKSAK